MKGIITILLLVLSFSFVAENMMQATGNQSIVVAQANDATQDTGEEQSGKGCEEDLKEKYCSLLITNIYHTIKLLSSNDSHLLQHYPSGFIDKPYMPPEVI
jgi:hypothetical protein